jgi:hypothetical protein
MAPVKSLDVSYTIIAALLHDVMDAHGVVFNTVSLKNTLKKVKDRLSAEGMGFLTKTLPRLGKALDKALVKGTLNRFDYGLVGKDGVNRHSFEPVEGSELPSFLGEFFRRIFGPNGAILEQPCVTSVKVLRQILYLFYKYELPYTDEQEEQVLSKFERTETELTQMLEMFQVLETSLADNCSCRRRLDKNQPTQAEVVREARILLSGLFAFFDPLSIHPQHGPGAVATKQRLSGKYLWTNVAAKITGVYPLDAYFMASLGHICDHYNAFGGIGEADLPARVILVPKDSRGPRLISCEPVDYQWVQQGLGRAIVELVERHPSTTMVVNFTDQGPNRNVALLASRDGRYSTLDLNEASDRVSLGLVRLLFPSHVYTYLEACRSSSTELPDGRIIRLEKFAPMGSSLCFPILALTIWALLSAAAPNAETRERLLVYGDDVIVPTAYADDAIEQLESFGLKINHDKSCTSGFFRESCGMDAFKGVDVTPVRLRTVWSSLPSPEVYTSWIAYANSFWCRGYKHTYDYIKGALQAIYGPIPSEDMNLNVPALRYVPEDEKPKRRRWNRRLQKREFNVWDVRSPVQNERIDGWSMLLRYFSEKGTDCPYGPRTEHVYDLGPTFDVGHESFSTQLYTDCHSSVLERQWR